MFGKQRAAVEIQAVADMMAMQGSASSSSFPDRIQRPASAPPRAVRSRRSSRDQGPQNVDSADGKEGDETHAIDEMERATYLADDASLDVPSLSIAEIASDTIERFAAHLSDRSLAVLFLFVVAWGAVLALDRLTILSFQTIALDSLANHSSIAAINTMRAIASLLAVGPFSTIADLCGRAHAFTAALFLYAAGHAAMAISTSAGSFTAGMVLYEIGACALVTLQGTVLADMTSARNRIFLQTIPHMPTLVFSFISSDIFSAIVPQWRFGLGLFAFLGPAALAPVISILGETQRTYKSPAMSSIQSLGRATLQQTDSSLLYLIRLAQHLTQLADLVGLAMLTGALVMLLMPSAAGLLHTQTSSTALATFGAGIALAIAFLLRESRRTEHEVLCLSIIKQRVFLGGALSIALLWSAYALASAFLPSFLYVVKNVSPRAQQNFCVIYSFTVAVASLPIALVVRHTHRFKIFAVIGVVLFMRGLGTMVGFSAHEVPTAKIVMSQVFMGVGSALTIALIQAAVMSSFPPAVLGQVMGALAVFASMGNAIGSGLAGILWNRLLPGLLARELVITGHIRDLPTIYGDPLTYMQSFPPDTATRMAIASAYVACWRVMILVATVIAGASLLALFAMRTPDRSVEEQVEKASSGEVNGGQGQGGKGIALPLLSAASTAPLIPGQLLAAASAPRAATISHQPVHEPQVRPSELRTSPSHLGGIWQSFGSLRRSVRDKSEDADASPTADFRVGDGGTSLQLPGFGPPLTSPPSPDLVSGFDDGRGAFSSPAPILVVDEAPFEPPVCPPTPPGTRKSHSLHPLSPMPAKSSP